MLANVQYTTLQRCLLGSTASISTGAAVACNASIEGDLEQFTAKPGPGMVLKYIRTCMHASDACAVPRQCMADATVAVHVFCLQEVLK
jgi:hypothetical protein